MHGQKPLSALPDHDALMFKRVGEPIVSFRSLLGGAAKDLLLQKVSRQL